MNTGGASVNGIAGLGPLGGPCRVHSAQADELLRQEPEMNGGRHRLRPPTRTWCVEP